MNTEATGGRQTGEKYNYIAARGLLGDTEGSLTDRSEIADQEKPEAITTKTPIKTPEMKNVYFVEDIQ